MPQGQNLQNLINFYNNNINTIQNLQDEIRNACQNLGINNLNDLPALLNGENLTGLLNRPTQEVLNRRASITPEELDALRRERDRLERERRGEQSNQPRNQELQDQIEELQRQFEFFTLQERIRVRREWFNQLRTNIRNRLNTRLHNSLERLLRSQEEVAQHENNLFAQGMLDEFKQELLDNSQLTEGEISRLLQARINLTREEIQQQEQQAQIQVPPVRRNN